MNWGHGIALLVISFIVFMSGLVFLCLQQDFYLVSSSYYEEGVAYDNTQSAISNYKSLEDQIQLQTTNQILTISIPTNIVSGGIKFYKPDNGNHDVQLQLNGDSQTITQDLSQMAKGFYHVQIQWNDGQSDYIADQSIVVD